MLQTACPSCRRALSLPESMLGQQVRCPVCHNVFEASEQSAPAPRPEAPPRPPEPAPTAAPRPYQDDRPPPGYGRRQEYSDYGDGGFAPSGPAIKHGAAGAATWMLIAGLLDLMVLLVFYVFIFTVDRRPPPPEALMMITIIALLFYVAPLVFLFIAASVMRSARGSGLIVTGSVMAFVLAFELLIMSGIFAIIMMVTLGDPWQRDRNPMLVIFLVFITSLAGLIISIIAGVRTLMALSRSQQRRRDDYYY